MAMDDFELGRDCKAIVPVSSRNYFRGEALAQPTSQRSVPTPATQPLPALHPDVGVGVGVGVDVDVDEIVALITA
ncbi:hypothetical protein WAI453_007331 [Rhynchosporium graminicola]